MVELREEKKKHQPINHSRKPLPGSEGCHIFQLLVSDPGWHQELLRIAGAKSGRADKECRKSSTLTQQEKIYREHRGRVRESERIFKSERDIDIEREVEPG